MSNTSTSQSAEAKPKGLEGVVAASQGLSLVDGVASKLFYVGIFVHELAQHSHFEETTYLLWNGKLPTSSELESFKADLISKREAPAELLEIIKKLPTTTHPMAALRSTTSLLSSYDSTADQVTVENSKEQALRMTAVLPTLIAAFHRVREGKEIVAPRKDLSHAANFYYMMNEKEPEPEMEKALDAYLVLLADHGLNASTFSARVTTATQSDLYSAVTSAIGTLKGDLHGSANQRAMEMILDIGEPSKAESYVNDLIANKKKIMGFGHRIYKKKDPRAEAFHGIADDLCKKTGNDKWMEISTIVEKVMWDKKQIPCNVDFYSASVLYILGFPVDFFTTVFAASRIVGWTAHSIDQQKNNRLIRPASDYTGPRDQSYVPIEKR